jgi:hypothetical protein
MKEKPAKRRLTEKEAREREERLLKAGLIPEDAPKTTVTLLAKAGKTTEHERLDEGDGAGAVE